MWDQVINENGSSFDNFTAASGTWVSDEDVIKQTDTAAEVRRAKYTEPVVTALVIWEAEVQIRTAGGYAALLVGFDGSGGGGTEVRLNEGGDLVEVEVDFVTPVVSFSTTIDVDTWYKLRLVVAGGVTSVYLDDTLLGSGGNNAQRSPNASFLGLYTYQSEVWFRNLKAWTPTLP